MSSTSGVVGPLANSATILALMFEAFFSVMTFSTAAGISISTSSSKRSLLEIARLFEKLITEPVLALALSLNLRRDRKFLKSMDVKLDSEKGNKDACDIPTKKPMDKGKSTGWRSGDSPPGRLV
ncbi:hypothetical protein ES703_112889 [subsurface metagenome]